jgi:hypothetical protein
VKKVIAAMTVGKVKKTTTTATQTGSEAAQTNILGDVHRY